MDVHISQGSFINLKPNFLSEWLHSKFWHPLFALAANSHFPPFTPNVALGLTVAAGLQPVIYWFCFSSQGTCCGDGPAPSAPV
jgi:hypothetical protein